MSVKNDCKQLLFPLVLSLLTTVAHAQNHTLPAIEQQATPMWLGGAPPNGTCSGAGVVALQMGTPTTVTGNNENAPTDPVFQANLVWEGFTIPDCADLMVSYCGTDPDFLGGLVYLVTGCPITNLVFNSGANIIPNQCGDGNFAIRFPSLPPGTYYYPVLEAPGSSGDYTLVLTASSCAGTPPPNALCADAIALTPAEDCVYTSGTVEHATTVGPTGTACGNGDVSDGVWYSFVATSSSHDITVQPSPEFNVHLSLISGSCTGQSLLACAIGQNFGTTTTLSATGLTVGNTYLLRVADWYAGAPRSSTFDICVVAIASTTCEAAAGNLVPDLANVCYAGGTTVLSATPSGNALVPPGFTTLYLLTSASEVVLDQNDQPTFIAPGVGSFSMRTLVYEPATFDPASIQEGSSTIGSLNELFIQGGGAICASLDITGAGFTVESCCTASAGTLTAGGSTVCWQEPVVNIAATPVGDAVVPAGYSVLYLLSTAVDGVIRDTASTASFEVTAPGGYRIHTLVSASTTYDPGTIVPGTTTLADIAAAFLSTGGPHCGALDINGVLVEVVTCCPGSLGLIELAEDTLCYRAPEVTFEWSWMGADVPEGYGVHYLIADAQGDILDTTTSTMIEVPAIGAYTLHALVSDTITLDLASALDTILTIEALNALLVQGGGSICALFDLPGTDLHVIDCRPANDDCSTPEFVTVQLLESCQGGLIQGDNTYATQGDAAAPSCADPGSAYADVWYVINSGENTGITILFDPGTMTSWGIAVQDACAGTELLCEVQPAAPVDLDTEPNTTLLIRIFSELNMGQPGQFTMCVTGAVTSTICDGGLVSTASGQTIMNVCQDAFPDVIEFATSSSAPVNYTYVVTDADSMIVAVVAGNALDFNGLLVGAYLVHGISHDGTLQGLAVGDALMDITTTGQCMDLSQNAVEMRVEVCSGLAEEGSPAWTLWPNPNAGAFSLRSPVDGPIVVQLITADGRVVFEQGRVMRSGEVMTVTPDNVGSGAYLVRVRPEGRAPVVQRIFVR